MKAKVKNKRAKSAAPMTGDQLLQRDNVVKRHAVPKELQNLKSANSFVSAGHLNLEKLKVPSGDSLQAYRVARRAMGSKSRHDAVRSGLFQRHFHPGSERVLVRRCRVGVLPGAGSKRG